MKVGDFAKYRNTGTVGKVVEVVDKADGTWVLLDTFGLYYESSTLDHASESEYKVRSQEETSLESQMERVDRLREQIEEAEKVIGRISPSGT
ncbi:MAG: DUF2098 domain-containing protein [Methanomassiliicoccales archaeon]|jgi:hypothetical protein|nr:DUF2098 domain-containing protein [Methanomassiliicoccales archaeon]